MIKMSLAINLDSITIDGAYSPYTLTIILTGTINRPIADDIVVAMHDHGHELRDAIAPTIEEAVQRILVDRAADCQERQDIEDFEI